MPAGLRLSDLRFPVKKRAITFRLANAAALLACCMLLSACNMFGHKKEKEPLYYSAVETPPLKIPEGLDQPVSGNALVIATPVSPLPQREIPTAPPRVASQSSGNQGVMPIKWSSEGVYLEVKDTQASAYRRVGLVIKRAGLSNVEPVGDDSYRFEYWHDSSDPDEGFFSKLAFWRDDAPNYSGVYQAEVRADGENARIYILNADGSPADPNAAEQLLAILGERLG